MLPLMKQQKSGKIINLSYQAAHDGGAKGVAAYAPSKGAIWMAAYICPKPDIK